jgi:AcrR family transcriptional regulator
VTDSEAVQGRIKDAATRLFVAKGYLGVSMREIAEATGLSKAGLYYHFKDKEDLFLAILAADLEILAGVVSGARAAGPSARAQVEALIHRLFAQAPEQRAILRLASNDLPQLSAAARERFGQLYEQRFIGQIEALLVDGVARGEIAPLDTRSATWLLLGMLLPFFNSGRRSAPPTALILRIFFEGVGPGASAEGVSG